MLEWNTVLSVFFAFLLIVPFYFFIKKGVWSPYFIVYVHLIIGIVVRFFYLKYIPNSESLIWFVRPNYETYYELIIFIMVYLLTIYIFIINKSEIVIPNFICLFKIEYFSVRSFRIAMLTSIILFVLYLCISILSLGGVSNFIYAFLNRVSDNVQGLGYVGVLSDMAITGSLVLLYLFNRVINPKAKYIAVLFSTFIIILLLCMGGRGNFIQYVMSLFILSDLIRGKKTFLNKKVVIIGMLFVLSSTFGLAIRFSSQNNVSMNESLELVRTDFLNKLSEPFSLYDHYELAKIYTEKHGNDYGRFYLEQFVRPIPRDLWPNKPQVLGKKIRQEFWGDDSGGVPAGLIGESYISFGIFGIPLIAIFLAITIHFFQEIYDKMLIDKNKVFSVFISILIPYLGYNLLRTGVDTAFTRVIIYCFSVFLFSNIIKTKVKFYER